MQFVIADTFLRSLEKLDGESQKLIKQAAFDFQLNPDKPSFQFHKLERCKDKRFSSARVNRDLRIIVHREGKSRLMLCYVDHHDPAYAWAERRVIDVHPTTGAIQLVEVEERVEEVVRRVVREEEAPLFANYEADYLLALGVPPQWLDAVRLVGESGFLELAENLPNEVGERLLQLADGKAVPRPVATQPAAALEHPDSRLHFVVMDSREDLARALDAPWEQWLVFLHPDQERYASQDFGGPARVFGGAGTGKTVVAVHRAVRLARACEAHGQGRVLLTTFTKTLAQHLRRQVELLAAFDPALLRLDIEHLHARAARLLSEQAGRSYHEASAADVRALLQPTAQALGEDPTFAEQEFWAVVDAQGIDTFEAYRAARRTGRGTPLGLKQRRRLWRVYEAALSQLAAQGKRTWNGIVAAATAVLEPSSGRPYAHVLVDESQDFGPAELRFVRALVAPANNDVFLCGDEGQRIYKARCSWTQLGLPVTGRSFPLLTNYRTTAQIRRKADQLLPTALVDGDGEFLHRRTVSPLNGPEPELLGYDSMDDEVAGLAEWLRARVDEGIPPARIAVFARHRDLLRDRAIVAVQRAALQHALLQDAGIGVEDAIQLGTMHRAKGLEFRAVAIIGCEDKMLQGPSKHRRLDPADREAAVEQERNLLYVACTRAREKLRVSWVGPQSPVPLVC